MINTEIYSFIVIMVHVWVTVLYRWCATRHRYVLTMVTVVNIPSSMLAVFYRFLVTYTFHVVQPDRSSPWPVPISNYCSFISKIQSTWCTACTVDIAVAEASQHMWPICSLYAVTGKQIIASEISRSAKDVPQFHMIWPLSHKILAMGLDVWKLLSFVKLHELYWTTLFMGSWEWIQLFFEYVNTNPSRRLLQTTRVLI